MAFFDILKTDFEPRTKDRGAIRSIFVDLGKQNNYLRDYASKIRREGLDFFINLQRAPYCHIMAEYSSKGEIFCRIVRVQSPTVKKKPLSFDSALINDGNCSLLLEDSDGVRFEAIQIQYEYHGGNTTYYLVPTDELLARMKKNLYDTSIDLSKVSLVIEPLTNLQAKERMEEALVRQRAAKVRYEQEQANKRANEERARAAAEQARIRAQQEEALNGSAEMDNLFRSAGRGWKSGK